MRFRSPGLLSLALLCGCTLQARQELPERITLSRVGYEAQRLNNCGPVNAMLLLNYFGHEVTQAQAERALKDPGFDVQVSTQEVAAYLESFGLRTRVRYAGDLGVIRALLARNLPVMVQQRLIDGDDTAHYRTVYAYAPGSVTASDPLRGRALTLSDDEFTDLWHYYNGEYLVAYPPEREDEVRAALGDDWDEASNWNHLRDESRRYLEQEPNDPFAWWGLAAAHLALGQVQEAAQGFDRAVEAGASLQYFWYRQEAFEAWNRAGERYKTFSVTRQILAQQPGIKEVMQYQQAARPGD